MQTMGDHVTDEDLDMIFMKVDTNCDGTVDWDEYLTYMLLECREKDSMHVQERQPFPPKMHTFKVYISGTFLYANYLHNQLISECMSVYYTSIIICRTML